MNRIFLSHSSTDKDFVRIVATKLGDSAIIDERDLKAGVRTLDEIVAKIADSKIFVIFLSEKALSSDWVRKELEIAINYLKTTDLRILVFSLDKKVKYTDSRIPESLRNGYTIRYIKQPELTHSIIMSESKSLTLQSSPVINKVANLFIGRGEQVSRFESDFSDLEGRIPTFLIASNYYKGMGRQHFVKHCLDNINLLKRTQSPVTILLEKGESVENFIIKLNSYVFNDEATKADLHELPLDKKIEVATSLVAEYKRNNSLIFIIDEGAIVLPNHHIADWFIKLAQSLELKNRLTFCLISKFSPKVQELDCENFGVFYSIEELDPKDTQNLFLQLLQIYGQNQLSTIQKKEFLKSLTGLPAQIIFTVQQIRQFGPDRALADIDRISTHSDVFSTSLIEAIKRNPLAYQMALVLADSTVSLDVLYDVFSDEDKANEALTLLHDYSALEYVSGNRTYVRLNPTIADYIKRRRLKPEPEYSELYKKALKAYVYESLDELALDDYSKFILALESALKSGQTIPQKYEIAPLLINNIIHQYNAGHYEEVEKNCLKLLRHTNYDPQVLWELHYHLIRVYARTGDEKFWDALRNSPLDNLDREFLIGFYYRNQKDVKEIEKALDHFKYVLNINPDHRRANREIVNTYLLLDDYTNALRYAEDNYLKNRDDVLHVQSYFIALIRNNNFSPLADYGILEELMKNVEHSEDPRAQDVLRCMRGEFAYFVRHDISTAERILREASKINDNRRFPLKALLIIYRKEGMFEDAKSLKKEFDNI